MAIAAKDASGQISILKDRGMIISNSSFARDCLNRVSYYNIVNAFKSLFLQSTNPEVYIKDTTFEELFSMYMFDVKLRELLLKYILIVENGIKATISREVSLKSNSCSYFSKIIYDKSSKNQKDISEFQDKIFGIYRKNITNPMIAHFIDRGDMVPLWALINVFDFGTMRSFYNYLDSALKIKIAKVYGISEKQLYAMLSGMNFFRNVCAHNDRLYNVKLDKQWLQIPDTIVHKSLHINKDNQGNYTLGKKDLFSMVISLNYLLLSEDDYLSFFYQLSNCIFHLKSKLKVINLSIVLNEMGFPKSNIQTGQLEWEDIVKVSK